MGGRAGQLLHAALLELAYMASIVHRIGLSKEDRILSAEKLIIAPLLFKRSFYCENGNHVKCKSEGFGGRGRG